MIFRVSSRFYDFLRLIKCINVYRWLNLYGVFLGYVLSYLTKRVFVWGGPYSVNIETASVCNLACPECMLGMNKIRRAQKRISIDTSFYILDMHQKHAFYCNLYFQGEPFLNPEIYRHIKYAKRNKYYTVVSSNGHFLSSSHCNNIIDSGLDRLIISLDGASAESYGAYRIKGNFNLVLEGIERLVQTKKELGKSHPFIVIQTLVHKKNEQEKSSIIALCKRLGVDALQFKSMQVYTEMGMQNLVPYHKKHNRYIHSSKTKSKCFRLWSHVVYTSDGELVACCYDKKPEFVMNVDISKGNSWKGQRFMAFRRRVLKGEKPVICENCVG